MQTPNVNLILAFLALLTPIRAHMVLSSPPSYRSEFNPNSGSNVDKFLDLPLSNASQFPCHGYQEDFGTPVGASVATWTIGASHNFTITGRNREGGGSCQIGLSYDKGKSFNVITSFLGQCPPHPGEGPLNATNHTASFDFDVPGDAPPGDAIFSWIWYNKRGNREVYGNCATVSIAENNSAVVPAVPFSQRPAFFMANIPGVHCLTVDDKDTVFPLPGPDVVNKTTGNTTESIMGDDCDATNATVHTPTAVFTTDFPL